jgi:phosphotransferase system HPr (HPr) family protein
MLEREMLVKVQVGLHARPAAQFAQIAKSAGFPVEISRDGTSFVSAASPLRLLTLKVKQGERIIVRIATEDLEAAEVVFRDLQSAIED